jgi:hypothetical protein
MPSRILKLRRPDRCAHCATQLAAGSQAHWDADARVVTCLSCLVPPAPPSPAPAPAPAPAPQQRIDRGVAGGSALREHERRKRNREQRTRQAHPHIGGLLLALRDEPQHELAFLRGARGEAAVAGSLEARTAGGPTVLLHDRRMPRGRGNIDHLAISANGIFVIDAKDWKGKVSVSTPLFGNSKLLIAGRDRTNIIDGLDRQVAAVENALGNAARSWPIQGVLCFTKADLPMLVLGTTKMRSHLLLYRKALAKRLNASGPFTLTQIDSMARALAEAFPPA